VDKDLAHKLKEEYNYEIENHQVPDFVKEFQNKGIWKIHDEQGSKEVVFKRTFGNENISVYVSTDALVDGEYENEFPEEGKEEEDPATPIALTVLVEKGSQGTLEVACTADAETFFIDAVNHFTSNEVAHDLSGEGDWKRRGLYGGPVFNDLDPGLVELFHKYLEERGFDSAFANFVPLYIEHKEQTEYQNWLKKTSEFVAK
ncbi:mitochondrial glycoprotein, partial [Gorgonomyces haynaldii]